MSRSLRLSCGTLSRRVVRETTGHGPVAAACAPSILPIYPWITVATQSKPPILVDTVGTD